MKRIYAMYKGDTFLCEGTREEICNKMLFIFPLSNRFVNYIVQK